MKKLVLLLTLVVVSTGMKAQDGIQFSHGTWAEIKAEAKENKKDIFIDCYTVWCGPCKALSKNIFPLKEVGDYFNANFINYKVDMEKGEGIELKKQFGVNAFPTLLWIDSDGEILHKVVGSMPADKLIEEAKRAPEMKKNTDRIIKKYKRNRKSEEHVKAYLDYLTATYDPQASEVAKEYIELVPESRYFDDDIFPIIQRQIKDPFHSSIAYMFKNKERVFEEHGEKSYFFMTKYLMWARDLSSEIKKGGEFNEESFQNLVSLMKEREFEHTDYIIDQTRLLNLEYQENWDGYMEKIAALIGEPDSVEYYTNVSVYIRAILYGSCNDPVKLNQCLSYVEKAFENYSELDLTEYDMMWRDKVKIYEKLGDQEGLQKVKAEKEFLQFLIKKESDIAAKNGKGIKAMRMMGGTAPPKKAAKLK